MNWWELALRILAFLIAYGLLLSTGWSVPTILTPWGQLCVWLTPYGLAAPMIDEQPKSVVGEGRCRVLCLARAVVLFVLPYGCTNWIFDWEFERWG